MATQIAAIGQGRGIMNAPEVSILMEFFFLFQSQRRFEAEWAFGAGEDRQWRIISGGSTSMEGHLLRVVIEGSAIGGSSLRGRKLEGRRQKYKTIRRMQMQRFGSLARSAPTTIITIIG